MALTAGNKLGPYEIIDAIGAGGMGEVYKARDTRLDRTVAIKVLPERIAENPDLRTRFEREAKAISALNHPNICTLHDVGREGEIEYIVMEYLEGQTLADRMAEEGPLPEEELLRYAVQIADALDSAHRKGLVHRDLKPGNVMLTREGAKLLDFGLAKFYQEESDSGPADDATRTTPLTSAGMILGTLQYMAPEQLEDGQVDARSDIFSFGAILYEMASGERAFSGKSQATLIASVLKDRPRSLSEVQPLASPALERLVRKCLEKDPESRWQSARDLGDELRWIAQSGSQAGIPRPVAARRRFRLRFAWLVAGAAGIIALVFAALWFTREQAEYPVTKFTLEMDGVAQKIDWPSISPDGRMVAFQAQDSAGVSRLFVRPLNSLEAYPLPGTERVKRPIWSPDGKYVAFFDGDRLKRTPASGGPVTVICQVQGGADGTWGANDIILFDGNQDDSIRQVPAAGGVPTAATTIDREAGEIYHAWPEFLPDGDHFLYLIYRRGDESGIVPTLAIGSLSSPERTELFPVESRVEYAEPGYLIYVSGDLLVAHPFDADALEVTGDPLPLTQGVVTNTTRANFTASEQGTLVVQQGERVDLTELAWFDRSGNRLSSVGSPGEYADVALSPDGRYLAYGLTNRKSSTDDIWVHDLNRGVATRFTHSDAQDGIPIWSPDSRWLAFSSDRGGRYGSFKKQINEAGEPQPLVGSDSSITVVIDWVAGMDRLIVNELVDNKGTLHLFDSSGNRLRTLGDGRFGESRGQVSPDGRYLLYQSNESGRTEIYVRYLEGGGQRWQISSGGAYRCRWSKDGSEIFYWTFGWHLVSVPVVLGPELDIGQADTLFQQPLHTSGVTYYRYDVSPDGERFMLNVPVPDTRDDENIIVIQNWPQDLKR